MPRRIVARQEAHRHGVVAGFRQGQFIFRRPVAQQFVGDLDQAAGAVANQRIGTDRAAMVEVDQNLQALANDLVRFLALDIGDEAHAACIVLVARVVEALRFWRALSHRQVHLVRFLNYLIDLNFLALEPCMATPSRL